MLQVLRVRRMFVNVVVDASEYPNDLIQVERLSKNIYTRVRVFVNFLLEVSI